MFLFFLKISFSYILGNGNFYPKDQKKSDVFSKSFSYISGNGTFCPQNLFISPFGETGCMSNLYYLLAAQSSRFLVHPLSPNTVS